MKQINYLILDAGSKHLLSNILIQLLCDISLSSFYYIGLILPISFLIKYLNNRCCLLLTPLCDISNTHWLNWDGCIIPTGSNSLWGFVLIGWFHLSNSYSNATAMSQYCCITYPFQSNIYRSHIVCTLQLSFNLHHDQYTNIEHLTILLSWSWSRKAHSNTIKWIGLHNMYLKQSRMISPLPLFCDTFVSLGQLAKLYHLLTASR